MPPQYIADLASLPTPRTSNGRCQGHTYRYPVRLDTLYEGTIPHLPKESASVEIVRTCRKSPLVPTRGTRAFHSDPPRSHRALWHRPRIPWCCVPRKCSRSKSVYTFDQRCVDHTRRDMPSSEQL